MNEEKNEHGNGSSNGSRALARLLNQLNIPTLLAVLFMGGSNFFVTKEDGRLTREEAERVSRQVNSLFNALDDFEKRQKDTVDKVTATLERQTQALKNQGEMLSNQQKILSELHRGQQNYKNR